MAVQSMAGLRSVCAVESIAKRWCALFSAFSLEQSRAQCRALDSAHNSPVLGANSAHSPLSSSALRGRGRQCYHCCQCSLRSVLDSSLDSVSSLSSSLTGETKERQWRGNGEAVETQPTIGWRLWSTPLDIH